MRAAISSVTVCSGETNTISAQNRIAKADPASSALPQRRSQSASPVAREKPVPMIGFISGESSMAPITTAGDDSSRPRMAMPALIAVMKT